MTGPDETTGTAAAEGPSPGASRAEAPEAEGPLQRRLEKSPRFADSFGLVLALLVVTYFVTAVAGDSDWGRALSLVVLAATTWLALRASQVKRLLLRIAMPLIPLMTIAAVVAVFLGSEETARLVTGTLTALLVIVAPVAIIRRLASHPAVSLNTFYGAVCIYLLLAMLFATLFGLTAAVSGEPFFAQLQPPQSPNAIDYLYFSLVTMTTVGYGDLTAAGDVGRMLAVSEAILGQLYLITVVALVVQNLGQEKIMRNRARK